MKLKDITVQIGGFHDHWMRNGTDNPTLLMAAMEYYHYDFICLMDGFGETAMENKRLIEAWLPGRRVFQGEEKCYGWGHVVTVENRADDALRVGGDCVGELDRLRGEGFAALAHITYPTTLESILRTGLLDRLIDEGHVDAIQLQGPEDWQWVEARARDGRVLPLIGGWDAHLIYPKPSLPDVIYGGCHSPEGHIDSAPGMRTVVFSDKNDLASILEAVRAGRTVLEHVKTGELFGSPEWVKALTSRDYAGEMRRLDEETAGLTLTCGGGAMRAREAASLRCPGAGTVTLPISEALDGQAVRTDADGCVTLERVPMPVMQDESCLPVSWTDGKRSRMWAVRVLNSVRMDAIPMWKDGKRVLALRSRCALKGRVRVEEPIRIKREICLDEGGVFYQELPNDVPTYYRYALTVIQDNGAVRSYAGRGFSGVAPRFTGDWSRSPAYCADSAAFSGGYGRNRPWPGRDVFSVEVRFAWDDGAFYLYVLLRDPVYVTPPEGHHMYNGDCVQLALDPFLKRAASRTGSAEYNIGVPKKGPQVWRVNSAEEGGQPPQREIAARLDMMPCDGGRIMTAAIPWREIAPVVPEAGMHMGVFMQFQNDNGEGLIDALQWPWTFEGMWMIPERWGTLALTE